MDYIRTENFVGGTELGQHPTPSSPSPAEAPVWQRLDPPVEDHLRFFPWRFESLLYEGIIYVLYV